MYSSHVLSESSGDDNDLLGELPFDTEFELDEGTRHELAELPFGEAAQNVDPDDEDFKDVDIFGEQKPRRIRAANYGRVYCLMEYQKEIPTHITRFRDLSLFLKLPPELLLEILEYLYPIDILRLSVTSHAFRNLLLDDSGSPRSIWRTAFHNHAFLPTCPDDCCPYRWTYLIFGPATCWDCGKIDIQPDFTFRRRMCSACMFYRLTFVVRIRHLYQERILEMLPQTFRTRGEDLFLHDEECGRVSTHHLERIVADLVDAPPGMNQDEFARWYAPYGKLVVLATARAEASLLAQDRAESMYHEMYEKEQHIIRTLTTRFIKRATQEGYHYDDLDANYYAIWDLVEDDFGFRNTHLTQRKYRTILQGCAPYLETERVRRLAREHQDIINARKKIVSYTYDTVRWKAPPKEWPYWPAVEVVYDWDNIRPLIYDVNSEGVGSDAWKVALHDLPGQARTWLEERKASFKEHLVTTLSTAHSDSPVAQLSLDLSDASILDLAIAAFSFFRSARKKLPAVHRWFVGWGMAAAFEVLPGDLFQCPLRAVEAAYTIVSLVGYDPKVTTASKMDTVTTRFVCGHCSTARPRSTPVYQWREAVEHSSTHSTNPHWDILTPALTEYVRARELHLAVSYMCHLCDYNLLGLSRLSEIRHHLSSAHPGSQAPQEDIDYGRDPRYLAMKRRDPVYLDMNANLTCNHCTKRKGKWLWGLESMKKHLVDKHEITTSDWTSVAILKSSSD